jgi:hypothetical protein
VQFYPLEDVANIRAAKFSAGRIEAKKEKNLRSLEKA